MCDIIILFRTLVCKRRLLLRNGLTFSKH